MEKMAESRPKKPKTPRHEVLSPQPILPSVNRCPMCEKYLSPVNFLDHQFRQHGAAVIQPTTEGVAPIGLDMHDWKPRETRCVGAISYFGRPEMQSLENSCLSEDYEHLEKCAAIICFARLDERPVSLDDKEDNVFYMTIGFMAAPVTDLMVLDIRVLEIEPEVHIMDVVDLFSKDEAKPKKRLRLKIDTKNFMVINRVEFWTGPMNLQKQKVIEVSIHTLKKKPEKEAVDEAQYSTGPAKKEKDFEVSNWARENEPENDTVDEAQCSTGPAKKGKHIEVADKETSTD